MPPAIPGPGCKSGGQRKVEENDAMNMDGGFQVDLMDPPAPSQDPFVPEAHVVLPHPLPTPSRSRGGASTSDQRFLLVFILGTYFGPDLRHEIPRKSALQRIAVQEPPYSPDLLGGNSNPCARVKLQSLYKFLHGHLTPPVREPLDDQRQFPDFFPPQLHRQSRYKGTYKVVESLVFIDSPDSSYINADDLKRFKQLSGLSDLAVDREEARTFQHGQRTDRDEERQARFNAAADAHGHILQSPRGLGVVEHAHDPRKKKKKKGQMEFLPAPPIVPPKVESSQWNPTEEVGPAMLLLPGLPTIEQWTNMINAVKPAIIFTGTAAARHAGPLIGLVDIGVCEDAYLFRTALPGVKKDEGDFNCEVEFDGKVTIKGTTTTGEPCVLKGTRLFKMQTQLLCPPGSFSVSFHLPGPVEPSQFTGTFGSDGILEGVCDETKGTQWGCCPYF